MSVNENNLGGDPNQIHPLPLGDSGERVSPPMVEAIPPPLLPARILANWEKSFVRECVKVIVLLSTLYGFDDLGYSIRGTVEHWSLLASHYGNAMKFVKNKLATFYSAWKGQELPPSPPSIEGYDNPRVLLGGRGYRWIQLLADRDEDVWESFLTSVLYSKKGMPRPHDELLRSSEMATFWALTVEKPRKPVCLIRWADADYYPNSVPITLDRDFVRTQLRRTVQEVYGRSKMSREDWIRPLFPSTSANYINSRSKGGAVGVILRHPSLLEGLKSSERLVTVEATGSARLSRPVVDVEPLYQKFETLHDRIMDLALEEEPAAVPLALPEALKVRVITKGPPLLATALKPLQKFLWRELKKCPAASLIGRPVDARFVQDRMGKSLRNHQYFLSVDYEAATDNLESWVSNELADAICDQLEMDQYDVRVRTLLKRSLTGHKIVHPEDSSQSRDQVNGQLMGSITSFPLLCLANLAVCRSALEIDLRRTVTLRDANLCVNGDDALMKCTHVGKDAWSKISSYVGLSPSVGKVYFSRDFLNINSTTFRFSGALPYCYEEYLRKEKDCSFSECMRPVHFERVQYVNLGLLKGLKRSGGKMEIRDISLELGGLGARARDLITSAPSFLQEKVLTSFISHHKELLREARVPWFLPERFGGLGLPTVGRWQPDNRELRLARVILDTGTKVPKKPVSAPWKVWQYATRRYEEEMKGKAFHTPEMAYEWMASLRQPEGDYLVAPSSEMTIKGLLCVEALFRVRGIKDIYSESTENVGYLRSLQKMWSKLRLGTYPEPLSLDKLPPVLDFSDLNLITSRKAELVGLIGTLGGNADVDHLISLFASTQLSSLEQSIDL